MNVIARLENELTYYDSAVHRFNHYTTRTPPNGFKCGYSTQFILYLTWVILLMICLHTFKCLNSSVWFIDETLTGSTTRCQSGPGRIGNKGILHIPQNSRTGISPSDGLVSYPGYALVESYLSEEMQSMYSTVTSNWMVLFCGVCVYVT